MYSRILCCVSERFFNIPNPTKLGRTELQESESREATEIMMVSTESRLNSSGTFSQDAQRCRSATKSMIYWATWEKHQKLSQEEFYSCQCSMTSPVTQRQERRMFDKCQSRQSICKEIWYWTMVIYWTRFWKEVVFCREQSTRSLGQHCGANVAGFCRKRTSYFPCNESIVQVFFQEQRTWKTVNTLHWRLSNNWNSFSYYNFCQSAQYLRSSGDYLKNLKLIKMDIGNLMFWWVNQ